MASVTLVVSCNTKRDYMKSESHNEKLKIKLYVHY